MTSANTNRSEKRVNDTFLAPLERPALRWLAARLPYWVTPDHLTLFGFLAGVLIAVSYVLTNIHPAFLWVASLGFILNWFGDSLDGTLARFRKIERPKYGFFIDHTVDALIEVLVLLGMGLSPFVDFRVACVTLIGYLLLSILVFIKTYVDGVFRISWMRLGPTEIRLIAILGNLLVFFIGNPVLHLPFGQFHVYDIILSLLSALFYGGYIVILLLQSRHLAQMDPALPVRHASPGRSAGTRRRKSSARIRLPGFGSGPGGISK